MRSRGGFARAAQAARPGNTHVATGKTRHICKEALPSSGQGNFSDLKRRDVCWRDVIIGPCVNTMKGDDGVKRGTTNNLSRGVRTCTL